MAWNISKAKRRALVALQLRDKNGRFIEMGKSVKWYSSAHKKVVSGKVEDGKDTKAIVRMSDGPDKGKLLAVEANLIEVIDSKATLAPKDGPSDVDTPEFEAPDAVAKVETPDGQKSGWDGSYVQDVSLEDMVNMPAGTKLTGPTGGYFLKGEGDNWKQVHSSGTEGNTYKSVAIKNHDGFAEWTFGSGAEEKAGIPNPKDDPAYEETMAKYGDTGDGPKPLLNVTATPDGNTYISAPEGQELYTPAKELAIGDEVIAPDGAHPQKPFSMGKAWPTKKAERVNTAGPKIGKVVSIKPDAYAVVQLPEGELVEDIHGEQKNSVTIGLSNKVIKATPELKASLKDVIPEPTYSNGDEKGQDANAESSENAGSGLVPQPGANEQTPAPADEPFEPILPSVQKAQQQAQTPAQEPAPAPTPAPTPSGFPTQSGYPIGTKENPNTLMGYTLSQNDRGVYFPEEKLSMSEWNGLMKGTIVPPNLPFIPFNTKSGDTYYWDSTGQRRWGQYGAEGALTRRKNANGEFEYLLAQRGKHMTSGANLWTTPGGAHKYQSDSMGNGITAKTELEEELGLKVDGSPVAGYKHSPVADWNYNYAIFDSPEGADVDPANIDEHEIQDLKWLTADQIRELRDNNKLQPDMAEVLDDVLNASESVEKDEPETTTPEADSDAPEAPSVASEDTSSAPEADPDAAFREHILKFTKFPEGISEEDKKLAIESAIGTLKLIGWTPDEAENSEDNSSGDSAPAEAEAPEAVQAPEEAPASEELPQVDTSGPSTVLSDGSKAYAGSRVAHEQFGYGTVKQIIAGKSAKIEFDDGLIKISQPHKLKSHDKAATPNAKVDTSGMAPGEVGNNPASGKQFILGSDMTPLYPGDKVEAFHKGETKSGVVKGIYPSTNSVAIIFDGESKPSTKKAAISKSLEEQSDVSAPETSSEESSSSATNESAPKYNEDGYTTEEQAKLDDLEQQLADAFSGKSDGDIEALEGELDKLYALGEARLAGKPDPDPNADGDVQDASEADAIDAPEAATEESPADSGSESSEATPEEAPEAPETAPEEETAPEVDEAPEEAPEESETAPEEAPAPEATPEPEAAPEADAPEEPSEPEAVVEAEVAPEAEAEESTEDSATDAFKPGTRVKRKGGPANKQFYVLGQEGDIVYAVPTHEGNFPRGNWIADDKLNSFKVPVSELIEVPHVGNQQLKDGWLKRFNEAIDAKNNPEEDDTSEDSSQTEPEAPEEPEAPVEDAPEEVQEPVSEAATSEDAELLNNLEEMFRASRTPANAASAPVGTSVSLGDGSNSTFVKTAEGDWELNAGDFATGIKGTDEQVQAMADHHGSEFVAPANPEDDARWAAQEEAFAALRKKLLGQDEETQESAVKVDEKPEPESLDEWEKALLDSDPLPQPTEDGLAQWEKDLLESGGNTDETVSDKEPSIWDEDFKFPETQSDPFYDTPVQPQSTSDPDIWENADGTQFKKPEDMHSGDWNELTGWEKQLLGDEVKPSDPLDSEPSPEDLINSADENAKLEEIFKNNYDESQGTELVSPSGAILNGMFPGTKVVTSDPDQHVWTKLDPKGVPGEEGQWVDESGFQASSFELANGANFKIIENGVMPDDLDEEESDVAESGDSEYNIADAAAETAKKLAELPNDTTIGDLDDEYFKKSDHGWLPMKDGEQATWKGIYSDVQVAGFVEVFPEDFGMDTIKTPEGSGVVAPTIESMTLEMAKFPLGTSIGNPDEEHYVKDDADKWQEYYGSEQMTVAWNDAQMAELSLGIPDKYGFDKFVVPEGSAVEEVASGTVGDLTKDSFAKLPVGSKIGYSSTWSPDVMEGIYEKTSDATWSYTPTGKDAPQNQNLPSSLFDHLFENGMPTSNYSIVSDSESTAPAAPSEPVDDSVTTNVNVNGQADFLDSLPVGTTIKQEKGDSYYSPNNQYYVKTEEGMWQNYKKTNSKLMKGANYTSNSVTGLKYVTISKPTSEDNFVMGTGEIGYVGDAVKVDGIEYTVSKVLKTAIDLIDADGNKIKGKPSNITKNPDFGKPNYDQQNAHSIPSVDPLSKSHSNAQKAAHEALVAKQKAEKAEKDLKDFAGASADEYNAQGVVMPSNPNPNLDNGMTVLEPGTPDPNHPLFNTPKPVAPPAPASYPSFQPPTGTPLPKWDSAEWLEGVKQRYLDNPHKAKASVEQSNNWGLIQQAMGGSKSALDQLKDNLYVDEKLYEQAIKGMKEQDEKNEALKKENEELVKTAQAKYDADKAEFMSGYNTLKKEYDEKLVDWAKANPNGDFYKAAKKPEVSKSEFKGEEADWSKAPVGTFAVATVMDAMREDNVLGTHGLSVATDSDQIEDLDVKMTKILDKNGKERFEAKFKLTAPHGKLMAEKLKSKSNVDVADGIWPTNMKVDKATGLKKDMGKPTDGGFINQGKRYTWEDPETGALITFQKAAFDDGYNVSSNDNTVKIQLPITATPEDYQKALENFGINKARPATAGDLKVLAENKLIAMMGEHSPTLKSFDGRKNMTGAERKKVLDKIKSDYGVVPEDLTFVAEPNGKVRFNLSDEKALEFAKKYNVSFFKAEIAGYSDVNRWLDMLTGPTPGMLSTYHRWSEGIGGKGSSSTTDMSNGSGDYVYLTPQGPEKKSSSGQVVIKPSSIFKRMDFWANPGDGWGKKAEPGNSSTSSKSPYKLFDQKQNVGYNGHGAGVYEVLPKDSVPLSDWAYISVSSTVKQQLIEKLTEKGILQINGMSLEDFIHVDGMGTPPPVDLSVPGTM